jgi:hypothetical protein
MSRAATAADLAQGNSQGALEEVGKLPMADDIYT